MKVFLTGASGYTGAVVLEHLLAAGHEVAALARPQRIAQLPAQARLAWVAGDFAQPELIHDQARAADAVVHIGAAHDVDNAEMERLDGLTIRAVADALVGSGKAFVNTSAAPIYGDTGPEPRDESEPIAAPLAGRLWRLRHDRETVAMTARGVRSVVIRPPNIYGRCGGVPLKQIERAQAAGKIRVIGDGDRLASGIHVDALARLYLAVLTQETAQGVYNAASDEVVRSIDVARVIAEHYGPGIEVQSWPFEAAHKAMGVMAEIAAVNCVISADRARRELGWSPVGPSLMGELVIGSYRALAPNS
jgi:nucleoside-diphosphate-sugar epimerase